jgi:hypothetical protein
MIPLATVEAELSAPIPQLPCEPGAVIRSPGVLNQEAEHKASTRHRTGCSGRTGQRTSEQQRYSSLASLGSSPLHVHALTMLLLPPP